MVNVTEPEKQHVFEPMLLKPKWSRSNVSVKLGKDQICNYTNTQSLSNFIAQLNMQASSCWKLNLLSFNGRH